MIRVLACVAAGFFVALGALLALPEAHAVDIAGGNYARIIVRGSLIQGLTLNSEFIPIIIRTGKDGRPQSVVTVEGVFARPDANLMVKRNKIKLSPIGEFKITFQFVKGLQLQLVAVGARNEVESETLEFEADWPEVAKRQSAGSPSRFRFTPGVNFSFINYDETALAEEYTEKALTFKAGMSYAIIPSRFTLEAGGYYTLAALAKSRAEVARFMGLNMRIGYFLPFISEPWSLSLQAGLYYTTMFVTGNAFGFTNMAGPQFYPVLRRSFGKDAVSIYGKISPVTTAQGKLFADRELAFGGAYIFGLGNGHPLPITLDISSLALVIEGNQIRSSTFSVGFGYGF